MAQETSTMSLRPPPRLPSLLSSHPHPCPRCLVVIRFIAVLSSSCPRHSFPLVSRWPCHFRWPSGCCSPPHCWWRWWWWQWWQPCGPSLSASSGPSLSLSSSRCLFVVAVPWSYLFLALGRPTLLAPTIHPMSSCSQGWRQVPLCMSSSLMCLCLVLVLPIQFPCSSSSSSSPRCCVVPCTPRALAMMVWGVAVGGCMCGCMVTSL
jgi:hypothetical protein